MTDGRKIIYIFLQVQVGAIQIITNLEKNNFYTREEAIEFEKTNKYEREDVNWTDEEEVNEILRENEFYDYEYFWNEYCGDYEGYEETFTTPNGENVIAFGYYGYGY